MRSAPLGQDICFDEKNVELGRNFCTKLWNAARFRQMQRRRSTREAEINPALLTSDDKWILLRLNAAIAEVSTALEEYRFSDATATLYRFFWSEYCDWYVEASKAVAPRHRRDSARPTPLAVIDFVLGHTLRLFHPFLPFITEELWHGMGFNADMPENQGGKTIMFAPWPKPLDADELAHFGILPEDEKTANDKYETVNLGRGLKSTFNINKKRALRPEAEPPSCPSTRSKSCASCSTPSRSKWTPTYAPTKGTPSRAHAARRTLPAAGRPHRRRSRTRPPDQGARQSRIANSTKCAPSSPTKTSPPKFRRRCSTSTSSAKPTGPRSLGSSRKC